MYRIIVLAIYVIVILFIGYKSMKRTKTFGDFFLANRTVGPWLTAFTYGTAYFSAVLIIGFAGKIGWGFGMASLWVALGNTIVGTFLVWKLLGGRIMRATQQMGVHTMPEYLEARYQSRFLKAYSAICIFVFLIPYSASVYMGLSYLFEINFNVSYSYILFAMAILTAIYLIMGGYKAITVVDIFQGMIMIAGILIMIGMFTAKAGGVSNILERLNSINPELTSIWGPAGWRPIMALVFLTSVAPFAMPQLVQKFYGIKDEKSVKIGTIVATLFALIITFGAYYSGALTRVFISAESHPTLFKGGKAAVDKLMPVMIKQFVPEVLGVIILLLVFAASMSTLAALVLVSSSSIVKDLYQGFFGKGDHEKKLVLPMRAICLVVIFLSVIIALKKPAIIVTMLSISWGAVAAVFLAPFVYGLLWKKATKLSAIVSSFVGLGTTLIWYALTDSAAMVPQIASAGMIISMIVLPIVVWVESLFRPKDTKNGYAI
ncbi:MAG: sodium/solute symporter [Candidatus Coatesbacteria bacterium]|nr:sodium/solute symporter [Candidatus Coatesbacteria bacterium]